MKESSFFRRVFSSRILPSWTILLFDACVIVFSMILAYAIRFTIDDAVEMGAEIRISTAVVLLLNLVFFRVFRTYSNILRYSSFVDVMHIFVALTLAYFSSAAVSWLWPLAFKSSIAPTSVLMISYVISFAIMVISRMAIKTLNDYFNQTESSYYRTYIYGTKTGVDIAKSLRTETENKFHIMGFVADSPDMVGKVLMGVNVYANDDTLMDNIRRDRVDAFVVSPLKADALKESDIADRLLKEKVQIFLAPDVSNDWDGSAKRRGIKEVQIEDLLGRDPIKINMKEIAAHLEGKRVLITGAAGSIGSEIMRQVAMFNPYQMILIDEAETPLHDIRLELKNKWQEIDAPTLVANITNKARMESIFAEYQPEYVFHAAAYKHVPMMEDNVSESIQNNVLGTKILADLAVKYKVGRFVMISTDKAVNPSNVMGCSKRICEIYVQALARKIQKDGSAPTQFITTRFGNVLGSNGSVIPLFRKQIAAGGPVTVTHPEIIRYFMTIPEACQLVLEAGSMGKSGEIYIFDMGKPVKIVDLAQRMIRLSGRTDVKIEFTGLRHGEKLYEELLATRENTKPTSHDKIMIATVREYDYDDVNDDIEHLIDSSYDFDSMRTVAKMKDLVPEFKSLNSKYSVLDVQ
ncbi:MAG: polysaccharide biosynthesis protein [Bacteroidales bacterium]|nr:polysaccharide biosynthesis protein [Bacteroidales bacterium]MBQ7518196.1 polysaccharide biosynthesis protein [Bacteroidales bacterium]